MINDSSLICFHWQSAHKFWLSLEASKMQFVQLFCLNLQFAKHDPHPLNVKCIPLNQVIMVLSIKRSF